VNGGTFKTEMDKNFMSTTPNVIISSPKAKPQQKGCRPEKPPKFEMIASSR